MLWFNPPKWSWKLNINNRFIIDDVLLAIWISENIKQEVVRTMDKRDKLPQDKISDILSEKWLDSKQVEQLIIYMNTKNIDDLLVNFTSLKNSKGVSQTKAIMDELDVLWYSEYVEFKASLIRWFDYYDGVVFEIFDNHPDNNRALFGGWRYNWLSKIFIKDNKGNAQGLQKIDIAVVKNVIGSNAGVENILMTLQ
jgi:histidyl-tRNA synthetase